MGMWNGWGEDEGKSNKIEVRISSGGVAYLSES